jgi:hypothetical protein
MPRAEALPSYAAEAPHAVMREIAQLALKHGFTQESLAKRWRESFPGRSRGATKSGVSAGNIKRHFEAVIPQENTIRHYAELLAVKPEYLLLLHSHQFEDPTAAKDARSDPAAASERYWLNMLRLEFESPDHFEPDTADVVIAFLEALSEAKRRDYLEVFALAWYREEHFGQGFFSGRVARAAFEAVAPVELKLADRRKKHVPGEKSFIRLFDAVGEILHDYPSEFDALIAFVRALYLSHGVDVAPMEAALAADIPHRLWREGNLAKEDWK